MAKLPGARIKELEKVLDTWGTVNDYLRVATEVQAKELLEVERASRRRLQYLLRLHARFNKERAHRERSELLSESYE